MGHPTEYRHDADIVKPGDSPSLSWMSCFTPTMVSEESTSNVMVLPCDPPNHHHKARHNTSSR